MMPLLITPKLLRSIQNFLMLIKIEVEIISIFLALALYELGKY